MRTSQEKLNSSERFQEKLKKKNGTIWADE